jgi:hypothetical protein
MYMRIERLLRGAHELRSSGSTRLYIALNIGVLQKFHRRHERQLLMVTLFHCVGGIPDIDIHHYNNGW